ncbi:DUF2189 domain-containing protein [Pelagibacterium xiamenense]|uniref:DUF2189 domain-containing protein n=1 Tax=Pelagibacterium xiamenense TaxID=2901140 RepID=UPI001E4B3F60|nr:DUF2189 domain-containing protein [Pelagibacterium xiamenense]MCD7058398.1 DUF2189 domain-containing protein [Pelagibacterium xiamenense]
MAQLHASTAIGEDAANLKIRDITVADVIDALRHGFEDFWEHPSHYAFAAMIYPVVIIVIALWVSGQNVLPLLYPLASGFALIGPFVALIFYEISRRAELGLDTSWKYGLGALRSPAFPAMLAVGGLLCIVFIAWLIAAQLLFTGLLGAEPPASFTAMLSEIFTTGEGWTLIVVGNLVGAAFALAVLSISVVSFPLMLDRHVGARTAIETSIRATSVNTWPVLVWGFIIAVLIAIGMATLFLGLVIIMPALGHASWHLYRKMIVPPPDTPVRTRQPG